MGIFMRSCAHGGFRKVLVTSGRVNSRIIAQRVVETVPLPL